MLTIFGILEILEILKILEILDIIEIHDLLGIQSHPNWKTTTQQMEDNLTQNGGQTPPNCKTTLAKYLFHLLNFF